MDYHPNASRSAKTDHLRSLLPYVTKYKLRLAFGYVFIILTNAIGLAQPLVIKRAIDALQLEITSQRLLILGLAIVAIAVGEGLFLFLTRQTIIVVSRYIEFDLRNTYFAKLQQMALSFFQRFSTGDLMARATNDLGAVRTLVGPGIMYSFNTITLLVGTVALMLIISPHLTLYALIPLPAMVYLVYRLMQKIHDIFKVVQEQYATITTHVQENISGIRVVKAYVQEELEKERFRILNRNYVATNLRLAKIRGILWSSMGFLSTLGVLIILWVGGIYVSEGKLSLGSLVAFFTLLGRLSWPMIALGWVINMTQQGIASMGRINEILHTPPEIADGVQTRRDLDSIRGEIEFRNVSFRYGNTPVLHDISFTARCGMTVAIVGHTGSGKSTLMNLIPRLLELTEGTILIDGIPIREIPLAILRLHIGYVPQETFLFSESIRENIAFGIDNEGTNEEIVEAATISQIVDDVNALREKFDTMLGERGINLSGGQKQRTAISRAVVRKPRILLLDDALSAVDTYTEEKILQQLRGVMKNRTSIVVSHRISTIKDADPILVLENGRIAERGNHKTLLEKDGIYADLYRKQLLEEALEEL